MHMRHIANEIAYTGVGRADDESNRSMLATPNSLGEWQD